MGRTYFLHLLCYASSLHGLFYPTATCLHRYAAESVKLHTPSASLKKKKKKCNGEVVWRYRVQRTSVCKRCEAQRCIYTLCHMHPSSLLHTFHYPQFPAVYCKCKKNSHGAPSEWNGVETFYYLHFQWAWCGEDATLLVHLTKRFTFLLDKNFFLSLVGFEPTPKNLEGFCPDPLDDKPIWWV